MKRLRYVFLCLLGVLVTPSKAGIYEVMNEPDSVYLFSYADDNGKSGLRFAWSPDDRQWFDVAQGYEYVKCDFGTWGGQKRMYRPQLMQSRTDGSWHCLWPVTPSGDTWAYAYSPDLLKWKPQSYCVKADCAKLIPTDVVPSQAREVMIGGRKSGYVQRVPYTVVEQLIRFAEHKRYRQALHDERTEQDPVRFAGLQPVQAQINVKLDEKKAISDHLLGIFFEDISYAADGGLYAELVQNRDFEYGPADKSRQTDWNATTAWTLKGEGAEWQVETQDPIHPNNPHYIRVRTQGATAALANGGWDGIVLQAGAKYDFSCFAGAEAGKSKAPVAVRLVSPEGEVLASATIKVSKGTWRKYEAVLKAGRSAEKASLELVMAEAGDYRFDMVSLFPQHTFKGRKNGLRADLAQTLADLKPRFVRFPGGCVAHGDGLDNMYDWKGSIGPLEARKPLPNIWRYHQTRGLGYHEYFLFCEDLGAEPVPVLAAGVPCQNSGTKSAHSHNELTSHGQQGGIPMEQMEVYIQDVLDLIEYANGDAKTTEWGRKRAEAGHPAPFNLKYVGIGNEDLISDVFVERFTMIFKAVKAKYPDIVVIGTTGPFYEGSDYEEGWRLATELGVPMVDEHYYVPPGWFIHNQDYYDRYDRNKSKVYLGEYAAHLPGKPNNIETALAEALYLTAVERNGDVVDMVSYAPLLAKNGYTRWNPDLIYFNNTSIRKSVSYYTQQMYGQNAGNEYITSTVTLDNDRDAVRKRIGVSVVRDAASGDYIVKLVNMLPVEVAAKVHLDGEALVQPKATKTVLAGDPKDRKAASVTSDFEVRGNDFDYAMPAYSFTVIRVRQAVGK